MGYFTKLIFVVGVIGVQLSTTSGMWSCQGNEDCSTLDGGVCVNSECVCPAGHQMVDNGRRCAPVAPYHFSPCVENFQCSRIFNGARCHSNENETEARCRCLPDHHYFLGRCWATSDLGESCTRDEECQSPVLRNPYAMHCAGANCACADGYYLRQRGECRKIGHAVGDGCVLDVDCQFTNGACDFRTLTCYDTNVGMTRGNLSRVMTSNRTSARMSKALSRQNGVACQQSTECLDPFICSSLAVCTCPSGYYSSPNGQECWAEIGSPATSDNCQGLFTVIENDNCVCPPNFFAEESMRDCVKATVRFSDSCLSDAMCHTFGAAGVCGPPTPPWDLRSCECLSELAIKEEANSVCRLFAGIGEICEVDSDCMAGNVEIECRAGDDGVRLCVCPDGLEAVGNLCLTGGLEVGESCQVTQECSGTENTVCYDGVCTCEEGFGQTGNLCAPVIGGACTLDTDCLISNTSCQQINGVLTCQCADEFVEEQDECWPVSEGFNSSCIVDSQCVLNVGEGSFCNDGACDCSDGYHFNDDFCWAITGLFEPCTRRSECYLGENAERVVCRNGYCDCDFRFPFSQELNTCTDSGTILYGSVIMTAISIFYSLTMN